MLAILSFVRRSGKEALHRTQRHRALDGGATEIGRRARIFREGGYARKQGNKAIVVYPKQCLIKDQLLNKRKIWSYLTGNLVTFDEEADLDAHNSEQGSRAENGGSR
ncbi:MAG: hypothetical protein OXE94_14665 [Aestuariivita sp.]|nr:hypothetical protein [Aestuariivita sp.]MCY4203094.1 hypothetical protein [Aestuariivita sp.]